MARPQHTCTHKRGSLCVTLRGSLCVSVVDFVSVVHLCGPLLVAVHWQADRDLERVVLAASSV